MEKTNIYVVDIESNILTLKRLNNYPAYRGYSTRDFKNRMVVYDKRNVQIGYLAERIVRIIQRFTRSICIIDGNTATIISATGKINMTIMRICAFELDAVFGMNVLNYVENYKARMIYNTTTNPNDIIELSYYPAPFDVPKLLLRYHYYNGSDGHALRP